MTFATDRGHVGWSGVTEPVRYEFASEGETESANGTLRDLVRGRLERNVADDQT